MNANSLMQPMKSALEQVSNAPKNLNATDLVAMCVVAITSIVITGMTLDYSLEGQFDLREKKLSLSANKCNRQAS